MPRQDAALREGLQAHQPEQGHRARASRQRRRTTRTRGRPPRPRPRARPPAARQNTEELRNRLFALPQRPANADTRRGPRPARRAARPARAGLRDLQVRLRSELPVRLRRRWSCSPLQGRLQGHRRHRARPHRPARRRRRRTSTSRSGPPAAAPRRSTRSRSSTAGSCSRPRRSTGPPARTPSRQNPTVGQVLLMSKAALEQRVLADPRALDLCLRAQRHRHRPDRPPRAGDDGVPGRQGLPADDHLAQVRPLLPDRLGQRLRPLLRLAVDIAAVNGIPILGNQGPGTITEAVIRDLMPSRGRCARRRSSP